MASRAPVVQALYELCRKSFTPSSSSSSVPTPQAVQAICSLMDTIKASDVGLKDIEQEDERGLGVFGENLFQNLQSTRVTRWARPITYLHIYECSNFTIGIFCLPTSSVIPLHDHPGMTVFSKILYGSMHVKAYDWTEPPCIQESSGPEKFPVRLAKLHADTVLTAPCSTSVLFPKRGGNLHCFTAVSSCAVLDVLSPSYSEAAGRPCTYYNDYPPSFSKANEVCASEDEYAWMESIDTPEGFYTLPGKYAGPIIQV